MARSPIEGELVCTHCMAIVGELCGDKSRSTVQEAVSLVTYRRQLLADAKKEQAAMRRLVRRCEKALDEAVQQMSATIIAAAD